jgi:hypothetical protein
MPAAPVAVAIRLAKSHAGARRLRALLICLFCCLIAGCAAKEPRTEFEIIGVEEQALSAIAVAPLSFSLSSEDEKHAWIRALLFFKKYTSKMDLRALGGVRPRQLVTSAASIEDLYLYSVEKSVGKNGNIDFLVACKPQSRESASISGAERNARNLARFIRDGILEESLITGKP